MRAYRYLFGVSAGAAIALLTGTAAVMAQGAPPQPADPVEPVAPPATVGTPEPPTVAPEAPTEPPAAAPAPPTGEQLPDEKPAAASAATDADALQPSANPLFFPTQSEEVRVREVTPVSLERAVELAQRNNSDLREARIVLSRSIFALEEALAAEFPTLDLNASLLRSSAASTNIGEALTGPSAFFQNPLTSVNVSLNLTYNLLTGGQRPAQIRLAEEQIERDRLDVERIAEQLRLEVATAYYEVQRADAQVDISKAAIADAEQSLRDAQLLEEAGLGTRFDVLQAEVRLADEQQNLRDAEANQRIARRDLTRLLGLSQTAEVTADGPPTEAGDWEMPLEESIVLALRNRAELEQILTDIAIAEENRAIAIGGLRPQVGITAQYEVQDNFDDGGDILNEDPDGSGLFLDADGNPSLTQGPIFSNGSAQDGFTIQIMATWRLFDGGAARAAARQQEQNAAIARTNFSQQRNQVRFEVEQSFYNLGAQKENISTAKAGIEQAEESLRLARLRFQAGVGTQTDVINAQSELTSARGNLLNAIVDYNISLANLERSVSNLPDRELFDLP